MDEHTEYWFQKKKYGIGLGLPVTWQGWVVYIGYIIAVLIPLIIKPVLGNYFVLIQVANQVFWTVMLVIIAFKKGKYVKKSEMLTEEDEEFWFPKKEFGIGYGLPVTWQGWIVYFAYIFAVLTPVIFKSILGNNFLLIHLTNLGIWTIIFIVIVIKKGEK